MRSTRRAAGIASAAVAGLLCAPIAAQAVAAPLADPPPAATNATSSAAASVPDITNPGDFAVALLQRGQWPVTGNNVCAVLAWENAEGGHFVAGASRYNPLNTTQSMPGDSIFNSVGVRNYPDWGTGLTATVTTLQLQYYGYIRLALIDGRNAANVLKAVQNSEWGTKFDDPAGSLSGRCLSWAEGFDRDRNEAKAAVDEAVKSVTNAQARVDRANKAQQDLAAKYEKMAAQVSAAQQKLGELAHSMYIAGMEPAIASKVEAIESGDPVGYGMVSSYSGYVGNRKGKAVAHAVDLLDEVASSRERAASETNAANSALVSERDKLEKASLKLTAVQAQAASQF